MRHSILDIRTKALHIHVLLWFAALLLFKKCGDPVREFDGFNKGQVEFLVGGAEGKIWELASRSVDGSPEEISACEEDAAWLFVPDSRSDTNPVQYGYNPLTCDSTAFCGAFPGFCRYDSAYCAENPTLCVGKPDNILNIGAWSVKDPPVLNTRTDTLFVYLWEETRTLHLQEITARRMHVEYRDAGGSLIEERYIWQDSNP